VYVIVISPEVNVLFRFMFKYNVMRVIDWEYNPMLIMSLLKDLVVGEYVFNMRISLESVV